MKLKLIKAIRWTEKYTRTDMVYLVKGGFWLLSSQAINFILALVLLWVFANLVSKEVYGQYRFLITVISLLALTSLNGTNVALTHAVALGKRATFFPLLHARIRWGLIGSIGALIGFAYYFWQGDTNLRQIFILIALFVPFIESYTLYSAYLNGVKDFRSMAILYTLQRAFVISILISVIFLTHQVFFILLAYLVTMTTSFYIAQIWTLRVHPVNNEFDDNALIYSKHLSIMSVMRSGAQYLDKVALWYLAGPVQVAQYVVSVSIPQELSAAFGQISRLALPKMSTRSKTELRQSLLRKLMIYFLGVIPVIIIYIISAPFFFNTFLPQYTDSIFYSQIASLIIISAPIGLLAQYFYAIKHTKALYIMNTVEPVMLVTLYVVLIPLLGIIGVLAASIFRYVFLTIVLIWLFVGDKTE